MDQESKLVKPDGVLFGSVAMEAAVKTALSDSDITTLFNKIDRSVNILSLADVEQMTTLSQVFRNANHCIIFIQTNRDNYGHWQALFRCTHTDTILFFDSYAHNFTRLLQKTFKKDGKNAYEQSYRLGQLIAASDEFKQGRVIMGTKQLQSYDPSVTTCGRHCVVAYMFFTMDCDRFTLQNYVRFLNKYIREKSIRKSRYMYDVAVTMITEKLQSC